MTDFELFDKLCADTKDVKEIVSEKESSEDECKHVNTIQEKNTTICVDCGEEITQAVNREKEWRYYGQSDTKHSRDPTRVQARKIEQRSINKDVEHLGFSESVINTANEIYMEVTGNKIYRGTSRRSIIFASIFNSLIIHKCYKTHESLMQIFELSKKDSLKGMKMVKLHIPKDSPCRTNRITYGNLISDIMDKFGASEKQKQAVIAIYEKIQNKSSLLNRSRPHSVASAVIYYWFTISNIDIRLKDFANKVDLSELTINKNMKEISSILEKEK